MVEGRDLLKMLRQAFDNERRNELDNALVHLRLFARTLGKDKDFLKGEFTSAFLTENSVLFEDALSRLEKTFSGNGEWLSNTDNEMGNCPIDAQALIEIELRDGSRHIGLAGGWNWYSAPDNRTAYDIRVYRVLNNESK
jgi:hypothetical protein